jgi:hypothetical protein
MVSNGSAAYATPGGGAQAAADAAVMRRRALDVIEVGGCRSTAEVSVPC